MELYSAEEIARFDELATVLFCISSEKKRCEEVLNLCMEAALTQGLSVESYLASAIRLLQTGYSIDEVIWGLRQDNYKQKSGVNIMSTKSWNLGDLENLSVYCTSSNYNYGLRVNTEITNVKIIVPNKVVAVTFADGTKEKAVCREPDVFSLETAIAICISKKIMGGSSAYNNAVKRGVKVYEDKLRREAADKAEQERIDKRREKRLAYKERRAAEREQNEKERQIEIQKEAYIRAMECMRHNDNE